MSYSHNGVAIRTHQYALAGWSAVTQDGYHSTHPVGRGATEAEAVADLIKQLEDA